MSYITNKGKVAYILPPQHRHVLKLCQGQTQKKLKNSGAYGMLLPSFHNTYNI